MKHERKRKLVQTCTICGNTGHNRRRCTVFPTSSEVSAPVEPTVITLQNRLPKTSKKSSFKPSVMVEAGPEGPVSPHVVNLKNDQRTRVVTNASVYVEPVHTPVRTVTYDWSAAIRSAKHAPLSVALNTVAVKKNTSISTLPETRNIPTPKPRQKKNRLVVMICKASAVIEEQVEEWREVVTEGLLERAARISDRFRFRSFLSVGLVAIILLSLPFPAVGYYQRLKSTNGKIVSESTDAFRALHSSTVAAFGADLVTAQAELTSSLSAFSEVNTLIAQDHRLLLSLAKLVPIIGPQVTSREELLVAGQHVALGNAYLLKGVEQSSKESSVPTDMIGTMHNHMIAALPQYQEALTSLSRINESAVPAEYREAFREFRLLFAAFVDDLSDLVDLSSALALVFGSEEFHRYLIVFQNPHELRPTGGFPGSLAVIDVQKGKIMKIDVPGGGPYDLSGQLGTYIKPPLPLQLVNSRWEFQDANWFPNFPTSAKKLSWFYQESRGSTVDGVIAINAPVLERFLKILGPVILSEKDITLSSENALTTLQYEVENGYDKEKNQPKEVIGDLIGILQERIATLSHADMLRLLAEVHRSLERKDIQISVTDPRVEKELQSFGWGGTISAPLPEQDYLMVVSANIRSQKSDAKITQMIEHQAVIADDGSIIDTVVIRRTHSGTPGEEFYGGPNVSYTRFYVPEGAELMDAGGFTYPPEDAFRVPEVWYGDDATIATIAKTESIHAKTGTVITNEFGKTTFGNWITTDPGETSEAYIVYKLPFQIVSEQQHAEGWKRFLPYTNVDAIQYGMMVQKQSGSESQFHSSVIVPTGYRPVYASSDEMLLAKNGGDLSLALETDAVFGLVAQKSSQE